MHEGVTEKMLAKVVVSLPKLLRTSQVFELRSCTIYFRPEERWGVVWPSISADMSLLVVMPS